jgi:hypothetical protein
MPAACVNDGQGGSVAVLNVEGRQIALVAEETGSGVRYGLPWGGARCLAHTGRGEALLLWRDGAADGATEVSGGCRAQQHPADDQALASRILSAAALS